MQTATCACMEASVATIKVLSWHEEVAAKAASLKGNGVVVDALPLVRTSAVVGELARLNPALLVLDMDRLPSNSREIALMLRASRSARHIPILFAGALAAEDGLPEKYARLKSELPDIPYAAWTEAPAAVRRLLDEPRTEPAIVPPPRVYTASLAQKLGVMPGSGKAAGKTRQVALIGAPEGFVELLGDLPETVKFAARIGPSTQLALGFIRSWEEFAPMLDMLSLRLPLAASAWIVYPKKAARRGEEFNENDLRRGALAAGFVDYKICSVDAERSAMKFARRKAKSS